MDPDPHLEDALLLALAVLEEPALARAWQALQARPRGAPPGQGRERRLQERLEGLREAGAAREERRRAEDLGVRLLAWTHPDYPEALHHLPAPPPVLYLRGDGPWPPPWPVTLVGARRSTPAGRTLARDLGREVVRRGGTLVSGLAVGIDQAGLEGATDAGGPACAVLACGLDQVYPPGARGLADRIRRSGRLVSEMPLGTPPYRSHFPRRNRILAALSPGTVVVEADLRSGSLITAHRALELGREVYAVPGAIDRPSSRGTNRLIRDGATPILELTDVERILPAAGSTTTPAPVEEWHASLKVPVTAAALARRLGRPRSEVELRLVELEAEGLVYRGADGLYRWLTPGRSEPFRQEVAGDAEDHQ